ncbi:MAG: hypothetical protein M1828_000060 [Chrysothrix sp. TS-e1954]|nr:MAG: hypothetical protein M1828_000060 [Chrysothrix sp. TS-e1954]
MTPLEAAMGLADDAAKTSSEPTSPEDQWEQDKQRKTAEMKQSMAKFNAEFEAKYEAMEQQTPHEKLLLTRLENIIRDQLSVDVKKINEKAQALYKQELGADAEIAPMQREHILWDREITSLAWDFHAEVVAAKKQRETQSKSQVDDSIGSSGLSGQKTGKKDDTDQTKGPEKDAPNDQGDEQGDDQGDEQGDDQGDEQGDDQGDDQANDQGNDKGDDAADGPDDDAADKSQGGARYDPEDSTHVGPFVYGNPHAPPSGVRTLYVHKEGLNVVEVPSGKTERVLEGWARLVEEVNTVDGIIFVRDENWKFHYTRFHDVDPKAAATALDKLVDNLQHRMVETADGKGWAKHIRKPSMKPIRDERVPNPAPPLPIPDDFWSDPSNFQ